MLAGSHRNAWPDETGTGGRTNRNTQCAHLLLIVMVLAGFRAPVRALRAPILRL